MNILSNFTPHELIVCYDKDPIWFNTNVKSLLHEKLKHIFFTRYMLQRYQQTKQLTINKKLKNFEYIHTLRQDLIIWFADLMRQHLNLNNANMLFPSSH